MISIYFIHSLFSCFLFFKTTDLILLFFTYLLLWRFILFLLLLLLLIMIVWFLSIWRLIPYSCSSIFRWVLARSFLLSSWIISLILTSPTITTKNSCHSRRYLIPILLNPLRNLLRWRLYLLSLILGCWTWLITLWLGLNCILISWHILGYILWCLPRGYSLFSHFDLLL